LGYAFADKGKSPEAAEVASIERNEVDPFLPFIKLAPEKEKKENPATKLHRPLEVKKEEPRFVLPLERYDIREFNLLGIAMGAEKSAAVVADGSGRLYTVYKGTTMGLFGGKVTQILSDRIIIEQTEQDPYGNETSKQITLKLDRDGNRGKI
jgi:Tfp pilus assembly protein PilP